MRAEARLFPLTLATTGDAHSPIERLSIWLSEKILTDWGDAGRVDDPPRIGLHCHSPAAALLTFAVVSAIRDFSLKSPESAASGDFRGCVRGFRGCGDRAGTAAKIEKVAFLPGFLRGLSFWQHFAQEGANSTK